MTSNNISLFRIASCLPVLLLTIVLEIAASPSARALTVNLAVPYNTLPSRPRSQDMVFYAPGAPDMLFKAGQTVAIDCQPVQRGLDLTWSLCRNCLSTPLANGIVESRYDNSFEIPIDTTSLDPGFYDLRVKVRLSGTMTVTGVTTFGWRVMDAPIYEVKPSDFDTFWGNAIQKQKAVPLDLHVTLEQTLTGDEIGQYEVLHAAMPESYDPAGEKINAIELYKVDFASIAGRVYGWFAKPVGPGPFPAMLVLPGAGDNPRPAPVDQARHGFAALDIQVHGYPVDLPKYVPIPDPVFDPPYPPDQYQFYDVYLNALQAVDALEELPGVDPKRIVVAGGSQGGRLSVVVAALDPNVKAAVMAIPHFAYDTWGRWTRTLNKKHDPGTANFSAADIPLDAQTSIESYYDTVNFAPEIRCPVLMNCGMIDGISPPTTAFALYRNISSPKQIIPIPTSGHDWSPAFDRYAYQWLDQTLGVQDKP